MDEGGRGEEVEGPAWSQGNQINRPSLGCKVGGLQKAPIYLVIFNKSWQYSTW